MTTTSTPAFARSRAAMRPLGPPPTTTTSDSAYRSRSFVNPERIARVTSASLAGWKMGISDAPQRRLQAGQRILRYPVRPGDGSTRSQHEESADVPRTFLDEPEGFVQPDRWVVSVGHVERKAIM